MAHNKMQCRAIVLFSGGLDSILVTRLLQEQGIDVVGFHVTTPFHNVADVARERAAECGIELIVEDFGDDYLKIIASPQWGYGKGVNPCIDCRVEMCRAAHRAMVACGADFVATGEVNGQRPNSQKRHQLDLIARESSLDGRLLRPLSAKTLAVTKPEISGQINRQRLYAFTGRTRGPLIRLARELGVTTIPQPSVGCLLCEKSYAPKLRDLLRHTPSPRLWDVDLLNSGRHLRIDESLKVTVGRHRLHCESLEGLIQRCDRRDLIALVPVNFAGPVAVLTGCAVEACHENTTEIARLTSLGGAVLLRFTPEGKITEHPPTVRRVMLTASDISDVVVERDESVNDYRVIAGA